jgi:multiple sugar transport system substrate-binding protein
VEEETTMLKRWLCVAVATMLLVVACGGGGATQAPAGVATSPPAGTEPAATEPAMTEAPGTEPAGTEPAGTEPAGTEPAGTEPAGTEPAGTEPAAEIDCGTGSGAMTLGGFSAGNVEDDILRTVLDGFQAACPQYTVEFEVVAGEYAPVMLTQLGSGDAPDLFYVQQGYSQDWISQGVLQPLDDLASQNGFDTSAFYEAYLLPFQQEGQTFGFPKDSSVLGMQTNDAMLEQGGVEIPTTVEELETAARALKDAGVTETPMCFASEYARVGAFIEAYGGGMLTEDLTAPAIDSPESREALDWILQMHADGLAQNPPQMGVDWCGQALGEERVAFAFEGNWVGPAMETDWPEVEYTVSPIPEAAEQATLSFTAAYSFSPDSPNPDASWTLLSYLTGQQGMQEWVNGGLVLPARSDVEPQSERQQTYAAFAEFARPGEGLIPGWGNIQNAFNGALRTAAEGGGTSDDIINATLPALQDALGQ